MAEDGITEGVGIVLAPHYSVMSVGGYIQRAKERRKTRHSDAFVESYHLHPLLIEALSVSVARRAESDRRTDRAECAGHLHRPQPAGENSRAERSVSRSSSWKHPAPSAKRPAPPIGSSPGRAPDRRRDSGSARIFSTCWIHRRGRRRGGRRSPIGFVSDHLEVLYDMDIEAKELARKARHPAGAHRMLNDDPGYIAALTDCVLSAHREAGDV